MTLTRIHVLGYPVLTSALRRLVKAALDQPRPTTALRAAANDLLDHEGHELSTKRRRKGDDGEVAA